MNDRDSYYHNTTMENFWSTRHWSFLIVPTSAHGILPNPILRRHRRHLKPPSPPVTHPHPPFLSLLLKTKPIYSESNLLCYINKK